MARRHGAGTSSAGDVPEGAASGHGRGATRLLDHRASTGGLGSIADGLSGATDARRLAPEPTERGRTGERPER